MIYFKILIILFLVTELALLFYRRSKKSSTKSSGDKRSLRLLWITISLSITVGVFSSYLGILRFSQPKLTLIAGIGLMVLGFIIRWIAIIQLGKMFTVDVAISKTHQLKFTGFYQFMRHPSYTGLILILSGIAVALGNILSLIIIIIPCFLALNYRMKTEEKALENEFGEEYKNYKNRVARIFPGIY